jgi:hypothetical protein
VQKYDYAGSTQGIEYLPIHVGSGRNEKPGQNTRLLAAKRFLTLPLGEDVEPIRALNILEQRCLEISDLPNVEMLQRRIAELAQTELALAK